MAERCPNCSRDNPDGSVFCMGCGRPLTAETSSGGTFVPPAPPENTLLAGGATSSAVSQGLSETSPGSTFAPPAPPENALPTSGPIYSAVSQALPETSPRGVFMPPPPPPQNALLASGSASPAVSQVLQVSGRQSSVVPAEAILPMGTIYAGEGGGPHAFAGHGVPVMHQSWLLEGNATSAPEVFAAVMDILRQRNMQGLRLSTKKLREGGFQVEERYYLIARRGVTTVFTYIAPAGRDLYISRATSVQLSISVFRVTVFVLLLAIALFAPSILVGMLASSNPYSSSGYLVLSFFASIASILAVPIWIYLAWYAVLSAIYWLRERDFWIYLRSRTLNNFQVDDIAHLEHATDETIHAAVNQVGLDASKIVPPAQGYRPERRVRVL